MHYLGTVSFNNKYMSYLQSLHYADPSTVCKYIYCKIPDNPSYCSIHLPWDGTVCGDGQVFVVNYSFNSVSYYPIKHLKIHINGHFSSYNHTMEHATATYSSINHNRHTLRTFNTNCSLYIHSCKPMISMYIVLPKILKKKRKNKQFVNNSLTQV